MSTVPEGQTAKLITPDEFHKRIPEIGRNSIYDALRAKRIKHLRIGRKILILESEVTDWPLREANQ